MSPDAVDAPGSNPPWPGSITTVVDPYTVPALTRASFPHGVRTRYCEPSVPSTMVVAPVFVTKIVGLPTSGGTVVEAEGNVVARPE